MADARCHADTGVPRHCLRGAEVLAKGTLTNVHNRRPTWLDLALRRLDEAVCAAYRAARGGDWTADMPAERIPEQLLALNLAAAGSSGMAMTVAANLIG